jgi:hypothetical protein
MTVLQQEFPYAENWRNTVMIQHHALNFQFQGYFHQTSSLKIFQNILTACNYRLSQITVFSVFDDGGDG